MSSNIESDGSKALATARKVFGSWVREYTSDLLRYASTRVKDLEVAEDIVQIALMAAWESRDRFARKSSPRTWLFSILKNKLADHYRKVYREPKKHSDSEVIIEQFDANGHWLLEHAPTDWLVDGSDHAEILQKALHHCLDRLPEHWRAVVEMKYLTEKDSAVICQELGITPTNYWQQIHRAKLNLRRCITEQLAAHE